MSDLKSAETFSTLLGHLAEGGTINAEFLWEAIDRLNLDFSSHDLEHDALEKLGLRVACPDCGVDDDGHPHGYLEGLPGKRECYEGHKDEPVALADFADVKTPQYLTQLAADAEVWEASMADPDDMEVLAAAEHESWAGWTSYMLERMQRELKEAGAGIGVLQTFGNLLCIQRWQRQLSTPYASLPGAEKESDRVEARKKLLLYRGNRARLCDEGCRPLTETEVEICIDWRAEAASEGWDPGKADPNCVECRGRGFTWADPPAGDTAPHPSVCVGCPAGDCLR